MHATQYPYMPSTPHTRARVHMHASHDTPPSHWPTRHLRTATAARTSGTRRGCSALGCPAALSIGHHVAPRLCPGTAPAYRYERHVDFSKWNPVRDRSSPIPTQGSPCATPALANGRHFWFAPYSSGCASASPPETGRYRGLKIVEVERLLGFPEHWTDIDRLATNARWAMLGKSFSIPCIA